MGQPITVIAGQRASAPSGLSPARRWEEPIVLLALASIVIGAVWAAFLARPEPPGDRSAEAGFARDMSVHHAQAVEMADILRSKTTDPELQALGTDIAFTQQAQLGMMSGWLAVWRLPANGADPRMAWMGHPTDSDMPGMATRSDIRSLKAASADEAGVQFLRLMIPHHRGGVIMARAVLARTSRPEVVALARSIVASQQSEIANMEAMLVRLGASPVTPAITMPVPSGEDGGHGHAEGFLASAPVLYRDGARLLPVGAGLFALAWLLFDGLHRRRLWDGRIAIAARPGRGLRLTSAGLLAAAGMAHLALAGTHFEQNQAHGAFFVLAGAVQLVGSAALVTWPSIGTYRAAAAVAAALVAIYIVFRLVPAPGSDGPEGVEAVGVATQYAQLAVVAACTALARRHTRSTAGLQP